MANSYTVTRQKYLAEKFNDVELTDTPPAQKNTQPETFPKSKYHNTATANKKHSKHLSVGTVGGSGTKVRRRVTRSGKKLTNISEREAWDHYLKHRPLRDEVKDQALGFDMDDRGNIIRDPVTGKPSSSCCKWGRLGSIRTVGFHEFSDLGPGLGLTFRFMQVSGKGFLLAGLFSCIGWVVQLINPKNPLWVTIAWATDLIFVACFTAWLFWLRRDMVLHNEEIDKKDITASDYAVQLYNLPSDATADEVAEYCSQFGQVYTADTTVPNMYDNDFDRTGVSLVRNDSKFISAAFELVEVNEAIHATAPEDLAKAVPLSEKRDRIQSKYDLLRAKKYHCTGIAFVCFDYQDGADACRRGLRTGNFRYHQVQRRNTFHRQTYLNPSDVGESSGGGGERSTGGQRGQTGTGGTAVPGTLNRQFSSKHKQTTLFRGTIKLRGKVAPNPSDILWKNLANSRCNILTRQIIINALSFGYLFLLALLMAFFAAHAREFQRPETKPPLNLGLLAVLGNVLCCVTSIVLLMPIVSTFEGVHSRSTLEIITFLKLGFFQTMGVVVGTIYVYSLDERAAEMRAFSPEQLKHVGSGLPTYNCSIPRFYFNASDPNERPVPKGWEDVYNLDPDSCYAFTLHLFGTGMGGYLIGTLIADLLLINMIDFLCPPWWIETMNAVFTAFQINLNKIYEGVDYKPFLRYQILLKFLMTAMFLSHIDNPRIMYFWVAACFWQSLEIDRYCYVLRYRKPPLYSSHMIQCVIEYCLPVALLIHGAMHIFFFGMDWSWSKETGLTVTLEHKTGWVEVLMSGAVLVFLFVWFLPLGFWRFGTHRDQAEGEEHHRYHESMTTMEAKLTGADLDFGRALVIHNKPPQPEERPIDLEALNTLPPLPMAPAPSHHDADDEDETIFDYSHFSFVEVRKYIPNPERREFGVLKLN